MTFRWWMLAFMLWPIPAFAQLSTLAATPTPEAIPTGPPPTISQIVAPEGVAPTPATPETAAIPGANAAPVPEQSPEIERLLSYKSVMYSDEELAQIKQVIELIKNGEALPGTEPPPEPVIEDSLTAEDYFYFPQFYLKTIVYYSPDFWVIWVNKTKITSANKDVVKRLTVTAVSPNQVEFKYMFAPEDHVDFSLIPEDERVNVSAFNRSVTFLLHINQTFSSYNWKIYEGKVKPARQDMNVQTNTNATEIPNINEVFPTGPGGGPARSDRPISYP